MEEIYIALPGTLEEGEFEIDTSSGAREAKVGTWDDIEQYVKEVFDEESDSVDTVHYWGVFSLNDGTILKCRWEATETTEDGVIKLF